MKKKEVKKNIDIINNLIELLVKENGLESLVPVMLKIQEISTEIMNINFIKKEILKEILSNTSPATAH